MHQKQQLTTPQLQICHKHRPITHTGGLSNQLKCSCRLSISTLMVLFCMEDPAPFLSIPYNKCTKWQYGPPRSSWNNLMHNMGNVQAQLEVITYPILIIHAYSCGIFLCYGAQVLTHHDLPNLPQFLRCLWKRWYRIPMIVIRRILITGWVWPFRVTNLRGKKLY